MAPVIEMLPLTVLTSVVAPVMSTPTPSPLDPFSERLPLTVVTLAPEFTIMLWAVTALSELAPVKLVAPLNTIGPAPAFVSETWTLFGYASLPLSANVTASPAFVAESMIWIVLNEAPAGVTVSV